MGRYDNEQIYNLVVSDGERQCHTFREIDRDYDVENSSLHIVKDGDNLLALAVEYYDDVAKWYIIADKNPAIDNPFKLTVGSQIIIPSLFDEDDLENDVDEDDEPDNSEEDE